MAAPAVKARMCARQTDCLQGGRLLIMPSQVSITSPLLGFRFLGSAPKSLQRRIPQLVESAIGRPAWFSVPKTHDS